MRIGDNGARETMMDEGRRWKRRGDDEEVENRRDERSGGRTKDEGGRFETMKDCQKTRNVDWWKREEEREKWKEWRARGDEESGDVRDC